MNLCEPLRGIFPFLQGKDTTISAEFQKRNSAGIVFFMETSNQLIPEFI
jgi:hypothetical protein